MRLALVALDDDDVAGGKPGDHLVHGGFGLVAQLVHDRPARPADNGRFARARFTVAETVRARRIDVELVVRVLDRGDGKAARGQLCDDALGQRRLAGILPAGHAEDGRRLGHGKINRT